MSGAQILPGSPDPSDRATDEHLPPEGRAALRAGVVGNWVDNIHVFLPLTALAPAMMVLAGPAAAASTGALIVVASDERISGLRWSFEYLYQTAGYVRAIVQPGC